MGRSNLQGTPWHYEYLSLNPRKDRMPSYCGYLSHYHICQNKKSLLYGDKCTAYMKHHCKFRSKKTDEAIKSTRESNKSKQNPKDKNSSTFKQTSSPPTPNLSLEEIIQIRKKHSKYFKSKIKPTLRCPKCKSEFTHRYQMEYRHGYAIHYIICHMCEHKWEHIVDDSLVIK